MAHLKDNINKAINFTVRGLKIKDAAKHANIPVLVLLDALETRGVPNKERRHISGASLYNLVHRNKQPLEQVALVHLTSVIELKLKLSLFTKAREEAKTSRQQLRINNSVPENMLNTNTLGAEHTVNKFKYLHPSILVGVSTHWVGRTDKIKRKLENK